MWECSVPTVLLEEDTTVHERGEDRGPNYNFLGIPSDSLSLFEDHQMRQRFGTTTHSPVNKETHGILTHPFGRDVHTTLLDICWYKQISSK